MSTFFSGGPAPRQAKPGSSGPNGPRARSTASAGKPHVGFWVVMLGLALVWFALQLGVSLWTDSLWYSSIGYSSVFAISLGAGVLVPLVSAVVSAVAVGLTLWWALRVRPTKGKPIESPLAMEIRRVITASVKPVTWAVTAVAALVGAIAMAGKAPQAQAWWHAEPFGVKDPTFGLDASFYVFTYPWLRTVVSFAFALSLVCLALALAVHGVTGALIDRPAPRNRQAQLMSRVSDPAMRHLSLLSGLALIAYGIDSLLNRVSYAVTDNSFFTGVGYTDEHARINAHLIIAVIAFIGAAMFFATMVMRRLLNPVMALVVMVVTGLLLAIVYPMGLQAFAVKPSEPDREAPYMERHIAATRQGWGIDHVSIEEYSAKTTVSPGQLKADAEALPGIRLIDPGIVDVTFDQLQQVRGFYSFPNVLDVDRYTIDGVATDAVVAAREIDVEGLPDKNWNNLHTVYTHGFGLVSAYGNRRQPAGEPEWISRDIPPVGKLEQKQARVYYGEKQGHFVVVGSKPGEGPLEFDTPGGGQKAGEQNTTYQGPGVRLSNLFVRAAYAMELGDMNMLLSDRVHDGSQLLYHRQPLDRVQRVAPWLTLDSNPYPTMVNGRLTWVVDGYTTSDSFPNSQRMNLREGTQDAQSEREGMGAGPDRDANYMRNAVKATVDAADGTVTLYAWDETDPILKTWAKVYPGTIKPRSEISADLMSHLRYPEDMFRMQREALGRYHMTDPQTWYKQADTWVVPEDPVAARAGAGGMKEPAYYLSIKWPGDPSPVFSLTSVYTPKGRSNLAAYMAVDSDPTSKDYGRLRVLRMSDTQQIAGPGQSLNAMASDPAVSERLRPYLNQGSAKATFGNLLTIPIGGGLLYVDPVYTTREGDSTSAYPVLRFVIVRFGESVAIAPTLQEALDQVFQGDAGAKTTETTQKPTGSQPPAETTGMPAVKSHLAKAESAFKEADAALKAGDLATYQKKTDEARREVAAAVKVAK